MALQAVKDRLPHTGRPILEFKAMHPYDKHSIGTQAAVDSMVDALSSGRPLSRLNLAPFDDVWTELEVNNYGVGICLESISALLSDQILIDEGLSRSSIDNNARVSHARRELERAFFAYDPFRTPAFHGSYLTASNGHSALLISLEWYEFTPYGAFLSFEEFEAQLRTDGYLLTGPTRDFNYEQQAVTDDMILQAWKP